MSYPIPKVFEYIKQIPFKEISDAVIRAKLLEYQTSPLSGHSNASEQIYTENIPSAANLVKRMLVQNNSKSYNSKSFEKKLFECSFPEFLLLILIVEKLNRISVIGGGSSTYRDKVTQILNYLRDNYTNLTLESRASISVTRQHKCPEYC